METKKNESTLGALFDVDGTIQMDGLTQLLVHGLIESGHMPADVVSDERLQTVREAWHHRLAPRSDYDRAFVEALNTHWAWKGIHQNAARAVAEQLVKTHIDRIWRFPRALLDTLRADPLRKILAISGSPIQIVEPFCQHWGFHGQVGTELELDQRGCFTGDDTKAILPYRNKGTVTYRLMRQYGFTSAGMIAMGNSMDDLPMLLLAEFPIAMNPNKNLYEAARQYRMPVVQEYDNNMLIVRSEGPATPFVETELLDILPDRVAEGVSKRLSL